MKDENREQGTGDRGQDTRNTYQLSTKDSSFILHPSSFADILHPSSLNELDTVLQVMCAAFELPYEVARPIFYADPYFDAANKRVLRVNGQIVSCLTLTSAQCRVGKAVLSVAGIAGVATLPEHQRRGYASRLLLDALQTLRERGHGLAGLFPYDYGYYRRMGWETASIGCKYSIAPTMLPAYSETAAGDGDTQNTTEAGVTLPAALHHIEGMANVYRQCADGQALWAERDGKRWKYVMDRVTGKYVSVNFAETVEGYLLYDIQPGIVQMGAAQREQPPIIRVLELCAVTARAKRSLIAQLAAQRQVGRIEYVTTSRHLEAMGLLPGFCAAQIEEPLARIELAPDLMLRIVDFPRLLQTLRVNWDGFAGEIVLKLRDEVCEQISSSVRVIGNGSGLPQVMAASEWPTAHDPNGRNPAGLDSPPEMYQVEGDVRVWSQVVVGHCSGGDACAYGLLQASAPAAARLVELLFPARAPFLPAPDHF